MNTILIATDFSPASRNAAIYGVELGRALDAKVILFSAYYLPNRMPSLNVGISEFSIMKDTEEKLAEEVLFLKQYSSLPIEIVCDKGVPQLAIKNISIEKDVDYIVIGMKGDGQNFKKIFGSTVTELTRITHLPVFIIPEQANFNTPEKIVFASDIHKETSLKSLDALISFTKIFHSKLYVVKVIRNENDEEIELENISPEIRKVFAEVSAEFEYPVDQDVSHALSNSINKHDANMLVMVPHDHDWLELLFKKSETKEMIYHTHIPILIFPPSRFFETE